MPILPHLDLRLYSSTPMKNYCRTNTMRRRFSARGHFACRTCFADYILLRPSGKFSLSPKAIFKQVLVYFSRNVTVHFIMSLGEDMDAFLVSHYWNFARGFLFLFTCLQSTRDLPNIFLRQNFWVLTTNRCQFPCVSLEGNNIFVYITTCGFACNTRSYSSGKSYGAYYHRPCWRVQSE